MAVTKNLLLLENNLTVQKNSEVKCQISNPFKSHIDHTKNSFYCTKSQNLFPIHFWLHFTSTILFCSPHLSLHSLPQHAKWLVLLLNIPNSLLYWQHGLNPCVPMIVLSSATALVQRIPGISINISMPRFIHHLSNGIPVVLLLANSNGLSRHIHADWSTTLPWYH